MFFDVQTKTPVSNVLYACLSLNSMKLVGVTQRKLENTVIFHKIVVGFHSHADSLLRIQITFQNLSDPSMQKYCLMVML